MGSVAAEVRGAVHEPVSVSEPGPVILVIDDHAGNRALACATLEDEDYQVVVASDGETGLAAFDRAHPQCVLLDIHMPGMDGIAACRKIRELPGGAGVAIVFVTAQHDVATFDRSLAAGGDDFVTKPYRPSELLIRVRTALRLRAVAHERDELYQLIKQQRDDLQRFQLQILDARERLVVATVQADLAIDAADDARADATVNEVRFRTLVKTSSALVWHASPDGAIQVNPQSWRSLTGTDAEPGAWGWLDAVHPADRARVRGAWEHAVATSTPYECQHRIQSREGGYAWVLARGAPIVTAGTVVEWIGMLTDVSDRVRVEEARERFIAILGHDLRNPLGAILLGLDALAGLDQQHAGTVARIGRSAHRMEAMIRDVLDFARGRLGGGIPVAPRAADLGAISRDLIDEMQQAYPARPLRLEAIGDLQGRWDPERVEQVLSNLIGNAVAHGSGPISVTHRDGGDEVITTVHNQGPPIPPALIPTLFDAFTGTSRAGEARKQGLGLGLYIASEIVRAHGGKISVSSEAGEGTTFMVRWPRTASASTSGT